MPTALPVITNETSAGPAAELDHLPEQRDDDQPRAEHGGHQRAEQPPVRGAAQRRQGPGGAHRSVLLVGGRWCHPDAGVRRRARRIRWAQRFRWAQRLDASGVRFATTVVPGGGTTTGIEVPAEVVERLGGGGRPKVVVDLDGYVYRSSIAVMGGRHLIGLSSAHRAASGLGAGDAVQVTLRLDTAPREVEVPRRPGGRPGRRTRCARLLRRAVVQPPALARGGDHRGQGRGHPAAADRRSRWRCAPRAASPDASDRSCQVVVRRARRPRASSVPSASRLCSQNALNCCTHASTSRSPAGSTA